MRWVVGIDLRPLSVGAVRFCTWLRETSRARDGEVFFAVHVLEQDHLLVVLRYHHLPEIVEGARAQASQVLASEGLSAGVEVLQALSAPEGLEAAREKHQADAIVIGRAARRDGKGIVRLGRVARRLLRSAAGPVVVAPPDLESGHLGKGPVVALTSLRADSVEACRFGASVAELLGRELAVVHVAPAPEDFGRSHLPIRSLDSIREDYRARAERGLQEWIAANALQPATSSVLQGSLMDVLLALVERRSVPLIVCGSRRLSPLERTIQHSTGTELAAAAPVPVVVVPLRDARPHAGPSPDESAFTRAEGRRGEAAQGNGGSATVPAQSLLARTGCESQTGPDRDGARSSFLPRRPSSLSRTSQ